MSIGIGSALGAYEITALLGEGGMGRVFRARDTRLKREVAIKSNESGRAEIYVQPFPRCRCQMADLDQWRSAAALAP